MQHLDEGMIHAWLDGELPSAEREALEEHIVSCETCAAMVAEARGFVAASSRILTALDSVPGGVLPANEAIAARSAGTRKRFTMSRAWMAAAAVLVLSTVTVIARRPAQDDKLASVAFRQDSQASREELQPRAPAAKAATPSTTPAPTAPTNAPARTPPASAGGAASSAEQNDVQAKVARKDMREEKGMNPNESSKLADAAPSNSALAAKPAAAEASRAREVDEVAGKPALRAPELSPESALEKRLTHERVRDSIRLRGAPLASVVVTGAGTTTNEKLGAPVAADTSPADTAAPRLVSRNTSNYDDGDTVVTTVYNVGDATVTLVERSRTSDDSQRIQIRGLARQPLAKTLDTVPQINSITWSDSSGHTRTLRGAVSRERLERIRAALFGATP